MRTLLPTNVVVIPANARRVFKGVMFDVYQWEQELFDGSTKTFEMLRRPDSVDVIAVRDGKIIAIEQEQPSVGVFYSFPGGRHDVDSETELQAAQREMLEETGMRFSNWKLIAAIQPHIKIDWVVYTFLATGFLGEEKQALDAGERITIIPKTIEEIKELNRNSNTRYLGREIFEGADSIEELEALPECSTRAPRPAGLEARKL